MFERGVLFAEKYEILEVLSSGVQSNVYTALQKPLERKVILKILSPTLTTTPEVVARFEREAKLLSTLNDDNVTKIYDFGKHAGLYFFVSEYIEGLSVKELLERKGRLSLQLASYIILESAKALNRLHKQGIVHRDLKPGNILLSHDGKIKLTDFGLAFSPAMPSITIEGSILGTPAYMPPEQILGKPVDNRSDIYSLGILFYELLIGTNPFLGDTYSAIMHNVLNLKPAPIYKIDKQFEEHKDLWSIIEKMIDKSPIARFQNISEVCDKLIFWYSKDQNKSWKFNPTEIKSISKDTTPTFLPKIKHRNNQWVFVPIIVIVVIAIILVIIKLPHQKPQLFQQSPVSNETTTVLKHETIVPTGYDNTGPITVTLRPITDSNKLKTATAMQKDGFGYLKISALPWAGVFVDGKEAFTTPKDTFLRLVAMKHLIELINPNFPDIETLISLRADESLKITIDLTEHVSFLQIDVSPWADIYIDNVYKATTPLSSQLIVPIGTHKISVKNPYYPSHDEIIEFKPKQTIEKKVVLK
jgi:serine/threonine-protein kinase